MTITAIKPATELSYREMQVRLARGRNAGYPLSIHLNAPKEVMQMEIERYNGYRFLKHIVKPKLESLGYETRMIIGNEDIYLEASDDNFQSVCKIDCYWGTVAVKHNEKMLVREATLENVLAALDELTELILA